MAGRWIEGPPNFDAASPTRKCLIIPNASVIVEKPDFGEVTGLCPCFPRLLVSPFALS